MAAETGFIIDGVRHEIPTLDTFTMDEAQVLYDYCGLTIEDFVPIAADGENADEDAVADIDKKLRNPGFLRALMHVSYQRGNPKLSAQKVKTAINGADLMPNFEAYLEFGVEQLAEENEAKDDAIPPASATEHERSWSENSVDSNNSPEKSGEPTGTSSESGSAEPENLPTTTGISESATPSPRSVPDLKAVQAT